MPLVKVIRKGIAPSTLRLPTSSTAVVLPMTLDRVGKEAASLNEEPTKVQDVDDAFRKFRPTLAFRGCAGTEKAEFNVKFRFASIRDFDPEALQKRQVTKNENGGTEYVRNDLANLKNRIELLYRFKDRWKLPAVRKIWNNEHERNELVQAFERQLEELRKVAAKGRKQVMADPTSPIKVAATDDILGASAERDLLQDVFSDLHPAFICDDRDLSSIFTLQTAGEFLEELTDFAEMLNETNSYEAIVDKTQVQIDLAEAIRDHLLEQIFKELRPIERSYRQLLLFFENSRVSDNKLRKPAELYVLNADPKAIREISSVSVAVMENFVRKRNDNFSFRDDVHSLVVPGFIPQPVRERLEDTANIWGMLFVTDLDDEKSFKNVERNFLPGGKYEFLKRPEDRNAAQVVTMGYLQLRANHWFEKDVEGRDDMYGPPSVAFAGAIARADDAYGIAQGPAGSRFGWVAGSEKCRVEPLIGEMEHLSIERYLIPIVRDADNHLCFFGCRTLADDPYGVLKFFTPYRILRYLERCCGRYLTQVAGQALTRDFMDEQIEKPLRRLLDEQVKQGTIVGYELSVDKDSNKRMQGICDIILMVLPRGPNETFVLKINMPEFAKAVDQRQ